MKYLVADDSKLARLSLIKSLKEHADQSKIYEAQNGLEAVEIVKNEKPEIVFLDLTMPIMDGYEAIEKILALNPRTNIIVVSADVQEMAKQKVVALGAKLHVQKPISSHIMSEILEIL